MLDFLLEKDGALLIFLNNLGNPTWDAWWLFITKDTASIPIYLFLIFLTYKSLGLKRLLLILGCIVILVTLTDQTSNFFKYGIERLRPCHDVNYENLIRIVKKSCGGLYSFFSAHAANSMGVAVFFSFILKSSYKWLPYVLIFWAVIVAYSRIYLGVHFPLDIIFGWVVGFSYAFLVYQFLLVTLRKLKL